MDSVASRSLFSIWCNSALDGALISLLVHICMKMLDAVRQTITALADAFDFLNNQRKLRGEVVNLKPYCMV